MEGVYELTRKQQESILSVLRPQQVLSLVPGEGAKAEDEFWKVIVFDKFNADILSLQLRIGDVRKYGVTLMLFGQTPDAEWPHT